jgi:hypothetical protein
LARRKAIDAAEIVAHALDKIAKSPRRLSAVQASERKQL